jgi:hypothetical protein
MPRIVSNCRTPSQLEVIENIIEGRLRRLHTWMPALVDSYDEVKQLVDCTAQVGLPYRDVDDNDKILYDPAPRVASCPVGFMGAGGFRITLPIQPGITTGIILFSESPIVEWLNAGQRVDPTYSRRFHISDAMFVPILKPHSAAFTDVPRTDAMTAGCDGGPQVVVTKTEVQLGGAPSSPPTDFVALAQKVLDELNRQKVYMDAINAAINAPVNEAGNGLPSVFQAALKTALSAAGQASWPSPNPVAAAATKAK